jgi:hypothetical protein
MIVFASAFLPFPPVAVWALWHRPADAAPKNVLMNSHAKHRNDFTQATRSFEP